MTEDPQQTLPAFVFVVILTRGGTESADTGTAYSTSSIGSNRIPV